MPHFDWEDDGGKFNPNDYRPATADELRAQWCVDEMRSLLTECLEYFEARQDVDDGDYGQPKPNKEMQMATRIRIALGLETMP